MLENVSPGYGFFANTLNFIPSSNDWVAAVLANPGYPALKQLQVVKIDQNMNILWNTKIELLNTNNVPPYYYPYLK